MAQRGEREIVVIELIDHQRGAAVELIADPGERPGARRHLAHAVAQHRHEAIEALGLLPQRALDPREIEHGREPIGGAHPVQVGALEVALEELVDRERSDQLREPERGGR